MVSANGMHSCQSPLSRMEMDHLSRKNALKATTAWPNERVSLAFRCATLQKADAIDADMYILR
jgi:hypothetical protein